MRFAKKTKGTNIEINYEGEKAWKLTPKMELYTLVCTASLQKKFYTGPDETIIRLKELILKVPAVFVIKLAIYAREKMYLRSIPLILAVELCKVCKNSKLVEDLVERVIQRADELTEILAYFQEANKREGTKKLNKLPHSLTRGIGRAFNKFDRYSLAKYNRDQEIKLRDVLFLTHPKAKSGGQQKIFDELTSDSLPVPKTWEVLVSEATKLGKSKKEVWEEVIDMWVEVEKKKIKKVKNFMALIRNLRNILKAEVSSKYLEKVSLALGNKGTVLRSKQLPFRFFSAYREIADVGEFKSPVIMEALEKAIQYSTENIKGFDVDTNVLIACDMSGSMEHPLSAKGKIQYFEIGLILGMLLQNKCSSVITGLFGDDFKVVQLPRTNILANTHKLANMIGDVGYSTNGYKAIRWLNANKKIADKVFLFTDCQLWDSDETSYFSIRETIGHSTLQDEWNKYKKIAPEAKLYVFDMAGYGTSPIDNNRRDVFLIAGWSEKVFEVLDSLEKGGKNLSEIEKIKI